MKIPVLPPAAAQRYAHFLTSRFGVPSSVMKGWRWSQHQEHVAVFPAALEPVFHSNANVFAAGIQAFANGKEFQPAANFLTLLGVHITQNRVELASAGQVDRFFAQKKLARDEVKPVRVLSDGWVAVMFEGTVIGSASLTSSHLIPNLPGLGHVHDAE